MRHTLLPALAAAAIVLAACGDPEPDEPQQTTRAEFIAKVDAQCKVSNANTKKLNEEVNAAAAGTSSDGELLRELAPILERGYGQVRDNAAAFQAANPPAADAAEVERIRKLYDEQAEVARKLGVAARRGDTDQYKALIEEEKDVVTRSRKAASAYGFKECGSTKSDAT